MNIVKNRFPNRSDLIECLCRNDTSFNSLCGDYHLVTEQIWKLEESGKVISSSDIGALRKLLIELEDEFKMYFENAQQP